MRRRFPRLGLSALTLLVAAGVGAAAALAITAGLLSSAHGTPSTLRDAETVTAVPVIQREYDDARAVEVGFSMGADGVLQAPMAGKATRFVCSAGSELASGESVLSIDGRPVLSLATSVPLWRDIPVGASGADVTALQQELARLGYEVATDGTMWPDAIAAVSDLIHRAGDTGFAEPIVPLERVLWIPAASTPIKTCTVSIGASVAPGDALADTPGALSSAAVARLPADLIEGARSLLIDGESLKVSESGEVTDAAALQALALTPSFTAALGESATSVSAKFALENPIEIAVVPPPAIFAVEDSNGCVLDRDGKPYRVRIIGSELGQSFIVFDVKEAPAEVLLKPDGAAACE